MRTNINPFVFLVGAGASKPMGVPTTPEFRREFEKHCRGDAELADPLSELLRHDRKQDIEEMLVNLYTLSRLSGSIASRVFESEVGPMLESYFGRVKPKALSKAVSKIKRDVSKLGIEYHELEMALLDFINEKCLDFDHAKATGIYSNLFKTCLSPGAKIFTTNYDPILEEVCSRDTELQNKYADGFVFDSLEGIPTWDFKIGRFRDVPLAIYKLHGSVTWYRDDKLEKIVKIPVKLGEGAKFKGGQRMYHLLIYPASIKDIYGYPFFNLYLEFLRALESARLLVVIGHSFRDDYIRSAVENKMKDPNFRLVVVNPLPKEDDSELARITSKTENVILCPYKFEDFCGRLTTFLKDCQGDVDGSLQALREEMIGAVKREKQMERLREKERAKRLQQQAAGPQQQGQTAQQPKVG